MVSGLKSRNTTTGGGEAGRGDGGIEVEVGDGREHWRRRREHGDGGLVAGVEGVG